MAEARSSGRAGLARRVAAAVLVVVAALGGWFVWSVHRALNPSPPDVAAYADASATRTADRAAADLTAQQLARIRARTPWAQQLGTSVTDFCFTEIRTAFFGEIPHWQPVSCRRTTVLYIAFDGGIHQRLAALDKTIAGLGWTPFFPGDRGLVAQDRYLHQPPPGAAAPESAAAAARPTSVSVDYARGRTTTGPRLDVGVEQTPGLPVPPGSWDDASTRRPGSRPYLNDGMDRAVYLTWQPVDTRHITAEAAPHRYTAAFDVDIAYSTRPPAASPTPSPSPPLRSPCLSGTHCG